ncbi:uncharacterized protein EI90DRAFT_2424443 [Cantharellus anzutake]|uniref:uncharacterized protein n=1 Tax=Cantharellus anzutake TaxID=1750568 RepID=UPI001908A27A|nr:uncharacterized protein EI90DRAFT_2424443 [Cantharellus anzutake]KAF8338881.1 hypothetical protein EI90DRAFT_2424443 [Cantharellus anzutake]
MAQAQTTLQEADALIRGILDRRWLNTQLSAKLYLTKPQFVGTILEHSRSAFPQPIQPSLVLDSTSLLQLSSPTSYIWYVRDRLTRGRLSLVLSARLRPLPLPFPQLWEDFKLQFWTNSTQDHPHCTSSVARIPKTGETEDAASRFNRPASRDVPPNVPRATSPSPQPGQHCHLSPQPPVNPQTARLYRPTIYGRRASQIDGCYARKPHAQSEEPSPSS